MWECSEDLFAQLKGDSTVVQVRGNVGQYRGDPQVVVEKLSVVEAAVNPGWFLPEAPRSRQLMMKKLNTAIQQIQSEPLSWLLNSMFGDEAIYQAFVQAPAAKSIHHAYLGGLLEHTLETYSFAKAIAGHYPQYINRDLLLTGALLHDCGKIIEYKWQGLAFSLTNEGRLFGHLVLGARLVEERLTECSSFPLSLRQELIHMILAHHGIEEWGSPQPPKTINAFALHHADYLSAELNHFQGLIARSDKLDKD